MDDSPPALLAHNGYHAIADPDHAKEQTLDRNVPLFNPEVKELAARGGTRVRDQHVNSAKRVDRRADETLQIVGQSKVQLHSQHLALRHALDFRLSCKQWPFSSGADDNIRSFAGKSHRRGLA